VSRRIVGLTFAAPASAPFGRPRGRGIRARGLAYQRALERQLPNALHGPWYEFRDANGRGLCQPDLVARHGEGLVVLEAKLTNVHEALEQLQELYIPVLQRCYRMPVRGVIVVRHATHIREAGLKLCTSLAEALAYDDGGIPAVHWLGKGPL